MFLLEAESAYGVTLTIVQNDPFVVCAQLHVTSYFKRWLKIIYEVSGGELGQSFLTIKKLLQHLYRALTDWVPESWKMHVIPNPAEPQGMDVFPDFNVLIIEPFVTARIVQHILETIIL